MSSIRSKNTSLEILIRKRLYKLGYRFRIHYKLPGKPDIVFIGRKKALFVHGCFWHLHKCKLSTIPKSNTNFWIEKLEGNKKRDTLIRKQLKKLNWSTFYIWECQIEKNEDRTIVHIEKFLM